MTIAESIQLNKEQIARAFGVPAYMLADPDRTAAPRYWSLCMTSENHGTVGKAGDPFSHAPGKHERVLVVEVLAATGASSPARPDWLEYDPDDHILTIYGVKYSGDLFSGLGLGPVGMSFTILAREDGALTLCRDPIVAPAGHVAVPTDEVIVTALHACAIDTRPSKFGFPELQVDATNVPGIRAVYMKIAAAIQVSTSGERQEGGQS